MLVLSRKKDEGVSFFDPAGKLLGRVKILKQQGGMVRLGIEFPENVRILRSELVNEAQQAAPMVKELLAIA